ncbi:MAG TPA: bacillithiol biosynthesis deacetylase BshB1 [Vicinamibacterales bacterium]|jgi:bacillithiol biosynthesis deacetylase BshB1|nr:bacillithiol biosynthesis deacetylase BshB1 [Vicinamibacterales bacterium]
MSVDLLVFGPHPDDLEIGLGGTIARQTVEGSIVGLCDLTVGELGTNGTPEERLAEAQAAANVLGAEFRDNLRLPDRGIGRDPQHVDLLAAYIRRRRPRTIAAPYWVDRHPDHAAASNLVTEAAFNAGLRRYKIDGDAWSVDWICYYFINEMATPSFVVDVSEYYDRKRQALDCHATQFAAANRAETRLNSPLFRQRIESRDAQFGALAGVRWAEGVVVREPLLRPGLRKAH